MEKLWQMIGNFSKVTDYKLNIQINSLNSQKKKKKRKNKQTRIE